MQDAKTAIFTTISQGDAQKLKSDAVELQTVIDTTKGEIFATDKLHALAALISPQLAEGDERLTETMAAMEGNDDIPRGKASLFVQSVIAVASSVENFYENQSGAGGSTAGASGKCVVGRV